MILPGISNSDGWPSLRILLNEIHADLESFGVVGP